jgi:molybdopterin molybdotransferase
MKKLTYLDYKDAVKASLKSVKVTEKVEYVALDNAIGRILSKDINCKKNMPAFNNSAMDGFAFQSSDAGKKLKVVSVIFAGDNSIAEINDGECYKIMTGAMIPDGADTIIPVEDTISFDDDYMQLPDEVRKGNHFRVKGEEYKEGSSIFNQGEIINSAMIAILASQGITIVEVFVKLKIAVLSTGNELKEPWENADEHQIYNSNSYAITSMLKEHNFDASYIGVVPDTLEDSIQFIKNLKSYDVVITTGGISMGDADFVAEAFIKNGLEVLFHGVNVKPGRPTMMGMIDNTYVMAMPGNPLTALINTYLLSLPIIYKSSGATNYYHDFILAKNNRSFKVKAKRANVVLGDLKNGEFHVTQKNKYGSGMLAPLALSNCVMITLDNKDFVNEDEIIKVIPFGLRLNEFASNIYN